MQNRGQTEKKIGVLGGTFDPIHLGHVGVARDAIDQLGFSHICFMPCGVPPHKEHLSITSKSHRLEMVRLCVEENPQFYVSELELNREGQSYTIDTLRTLKSEGPHVSWTLIVGGDTLWQIPSWKEGEQLLRDFSVAVCVRKGFACERLSETIEVLTTRYGADISYFVADAPDVSSTEIRRDVLAKKNVGAMVGKKVAHYIEKNRLYQGEKL